MDIELLNLMNNMVHSTTSKVSGGRKSGSINYDDAVLLQLISESLPNSTEQWNAFAQSYKILTKEPLLREGKALRLMNYPQ